MAVGIRAIDHTLVGNHIHSREEALDSIPSTPKIVAERFRRTLATFEQCPFEGTSSTVHYTLGMVAYSVTSFYELMRMLYAGLKYFLR